MEVIRRGGRTWTTISF